MPSVDPVLARPRLPFSFQLGLIVIAFRLTAIKRHDLRCLSAAVSRGGHPLLDILPTLREGHHLLAAVAFKFPGPVRRRHLNPIAEPLYLLGDLEAINCRPEALRAIILDAIHPAPLAVRPAGDIQ